jgi:quinol monooxygenase YgiN
MVRYGLLARLEAKPGKEAEVEALLAGALPLAQAEAATRNWYAFRLGPSTFGIFDTFDDEAGRQAHLEGEIAKALMANADRLLATAPQIDRIDVLATK